MSISLLDSRQYWTFTEPRFKNCSQKGADVPEQLIGVLVFTVLDLLYNCHTRVAQGYILFRCRTLISIWLGFPEATHLYIRRPIKYDQIQLCKSYTDVYEGYFTKGWKVSLLNWVNIHIHNMDVIQIIYHRVI